MAPPFWVHMTTFPSMLCQIVHKNLGRLVPVPTPFKTIFHTFLQSFLESHPDFEPPFTPYPLFEWYVQSKDIFIKFRYEMLKLSI
jgi:hypothetical protein